MELKLVQFKGTFRGTVLLTKHLYFQFASLKSKGRCNKFSVFNVTIEKQDVGTANHASNESPETCIC